MRIKPKDRHLLSEAYNTLYENTLSSGQSVQSISITSSSSSSECKDCEKTDMVLNNLVNLNHKSAELVQIIQNVTEEGADIEQWVSEKIAIAAYSLGSILDYYAKYKTQVAGISMGDQEEEEQDVGIKTGLRLEPSTMAASFPLKTNMPPMSLTSQL